MFWYAAWHHCANGILNLCVKWESEDFDFWNPSVTSLSTASVRSVLKCSVFSQKIEDRVTSLQIACCHKQNWVFFTLWARKLWKLVQPNELCYASFFIIIIFLFFIFTCSSHLFSGETAFLSFNWSSSRGLGDLATSSLNLISKSWMKFVKHFRGNRYPQKVSKKKRRGRKTATGKEKDGFCAGGSLLRFLQKKKKKKFVVLTCWWAQMVMSLLQGWASKTFIRFFFLFFFFFFCLCRPGSRVYTQIFVRASWGFACDVSTTQY